jgi:hypothetical protein
MSGLITLRPGFITYSNSALINDFEAMPVGPTTVLTGWIIHGNASAGAVSFAPRM